MVAFFLSFSFFFFISLSLSLSLSLSYLHRLHRLYRLHDPYAKYANASFASHVELLPYLPGGLPLEVRALPLVGHQKEHGEQCPMLSVPSVGIGEGAVLAADVPVDVERRSHISNLGCGLK